MATKKVVPYYKNKYWQGTLTVAECEALLQTIGQKAVPELRHCICNLGDDQIAYLKEHTEEDMSDMSVGQLTDLQTVGVKFMYLSRRCLIGDQVGLGKTVQSAGLMNLLRKNYGYSTLFLTEKTSAEQIRDKLMKFTGRYVELVQTAENTRVKKFIATHKEGYDVVGTHALLSCSSFLAWCAEHPFSCIIIDESSIVRTSTTQAYRGAKALFKKAKYAILLNATPLETTLQDLYNQLKLVDEPLVPTKTEFERAFCKKRPSKNGVYWEIEGYKNANVFNEAVKLRYLAHTREESGAVCENNAIEVLQIPQTKIQKRITPLTSLHALVADYPTGVYPDIEYTEETTGKLRVLVQLMETLKEKKVIIYCKYKECQKALLSYLTEKGRKPYILNGEVKDTERNRVITAINTGEVATLMTNIVRAYDVQDCDICILYSMDGNPQAMVQLFGRITREFDIRNKSLYFFVSEGREQALFENNIKNKASASLRFTQGSNFVLEHIAHCNLLDV